MMSCQKFILVISLLVFCLLSAPGAAATRPENGDQLSVAGVVRDAQGKGIKGVKAEVTVAGRPVLSESPEAIVTDKKGSFLVKFIAPAGTLPQSRVEVRVSKPSWKSTVIPVKVVARGTGGGDGFQALGLLTLQRQATPAFWLATLILLGVYLIISLEWLHRASTNVVTVGLAERAGYPISFLAYMKACFVPMLITILLSSGYLLIFFR